MYYKHSLKIITDIFALNSAHGSTSPAVFFAQKHGSEFVSEPLLPLSY